MDIYIVKDNLYPVISCKSNEAFIILGNHDYFLNLILKKLESKTTFFVKYIVNSDTYGSLCLKMIDSSFKVNDKLVSVDEFISLGYFRHWCTKKLSTIDNLTKKDRMLIHDITFLECALWKRILLLFCPNTINESHEHFLTNPFIFIDSRDMFNNLILRSAVNSFIFKTPNSKLELLINHILSEKVLDKTTALVNLKDVVNVNLATKLYDRNMFRSFVYSWFNIQLNNCLEDKNVKTTFNDVDELI
ncbi:81R [Yaba monkey tumor virus]|uniref:81R n=1 Tax=Yaba monkey tumor virus (strain VR587) TaxID=928314 RepID=Q6TUT4_YMTV5|nr:81R [Yaba monkey tumor virus]AAR07437.1 81R [Yaba monkey tumor virus]